jgi:hypothetical protein
MKKLLPVFLLLLSCSKDSSYQANKPSTPLSNSLLVIKGTLELQTSDANIASLGIVNYRSSYELCGTSGSDLLWPVSLPLSDSSVYSSSILAEGDSLSAEVYLDTTFKKNYYISMSITENTVLVNNQTVFSRWNLTRNFAFHTGSKYECTVTVK